jgi:FKBP-type peptidyl-prolyl cis-trans isomerase (trigger factor)
VTVPGDQTRKAFDQALRKITNDPKFSVPGFRKGAKVPDNVAIRALGGEKVIVNEALDILCEDALKKAIDQSGVKAVGQVSR